MSEATLPSRVISVLVLDQSGVLTRVSALFSRRGFNIDSLAVGKTEDPAVSRITVVTQADDQTVEQLTKQLNKLVEVLKVVELEPRAIIRELFLIKVRALPADRGQILEVIQLFEAKPLDVTTDTITLEVAGTPSKISAMIEILTPFGIREMVQSGMVALNRGPRSITDRNRTADRLLKPLNSAPAAVQSGH